MAIRYRVLASAEKRGLGGKARKSGGVWIVIATQLCKM
jgi:hypothetical protein